MKLVASVGDPILNSGKNTSKKVEQEEKTEISIEIAIKVVILQLQECRAIYFYKDIEAGGSKAQDNNYLALDGCTITEGLRKTGIDEGLVNRIQELKKKDSVLKSRTKLTFKILRRWFCRGSVASSIEYIKRKR